MLGEVSTQGVSCLVRSPTKVCHAWWGLQQWCVMLGEVSTQGVSCLVRSPAKVCHAWWGLQQKSCVMFCWGLQQLNKQRDWGQNFCQCKDLRRGVSGYRAFGCVVADLTQLSRGGWQDCTTGCYCCRPYSTLQRWMLGLYDWLFLCCRPYWTWRSVWVKPNLGGWPRWRSSSCPAIVSTARCGATTWTRRRAWCACVTLRVANFCAFCHACMSFTPSVSTSGWRYIQHVQACKEKIDFSYPSKTSC